MMIILVQLTSQEKKIMREAGMDVSWRHNTALQDVISMQLAEPADKLFKKYMAESKDMPALEVIQDELMPEMAESETE